MLHLKLLKKSGMLLANSRLKVHDVVRAVSISHGSLISILNDNLGLSELSAKWVPRRLTIDKRNRCDNFEAVFGVVQSPSGSVLAVS